MVWVSLKFHTSDRIRKLTQHRSGPVSYYQPTMFRLAGVASNDTRLLLQGFQNVVQLFGAVIGALLTDKWGRRPQLMVSTALMVFVFVIITVLNATNPDIKDSEDEDDFSVKSPAQSKAQVAMIFIFGFIYSCGWTPNQSMYPVEVLRYESRAKGMGMYNVSFTYPWNVRRLAYTQLDSSLSILRSFTTHSLRRLPSPELAGDITSSSSFGTCSRLSSYTSSSSRRRGGRWKK